MSPLTLHPPDSETAVILLLLSSLLTSHLLLWTFLGLLAVISGFMLYLSFYFRSASLNLEGVSRVWGKDGYLVKREAVEEAGQVEVPNLRPSLGPEAKAAVLPLTPAPKASPELEPEKQQLASSLFVGLASHSSVSLVRVLKPSAISGFCTSLFILFSLNRWESLRRTPIVSEEKPRPQTRPRRECPTLRSLLRARWIT